MAKKKKTPAKKSGNDKKADKKKTTIKKLTKNAKQKPQAKKGSAKRKPSRTGKTTKGKNSKVLRPAKSVSINKAKTKPRINKGGKGFKRTSKGNERKRYRDFDTSNKVTNIKGKNTITITVNSKPAKATNKLNGIAGSKKLDYLLKKNKPLKNAPPKEPQRAVIIFEVKTNDGPKSYSFITPPEFIVNADTVENFVLERVENALAETESLNPDKSGGTITDLTIENISIKFIY